MTEQSKSSRENKQSTRVVLSWSSQIYEISSSSKKMSSKCAAQHGYAYKVARYSFGNRSSIIHKIAFVWISTAHVQQHNEHILHMKFIIDRGGGGVRRGLWRLEGNRWFSPPASVTSRLASVTFKVANKVFIEETDTNFELSRQYCSDFLDLETLGSLLS